MEVTLALTWLDPPPAMTTPDMAKELFTPSSLPSQSSSSISLWLEVGIEAVHDTN